MLISTQFYLVYRIAFYLFRNTWKRMDIFIIMKVSRIYKKRYSTMNVVCVFRTLCFIISKLLNLENKKNFRLIYLVIASHAAINRLGRQLYKP